MATLRTRMFQRRAAALLIAGGAISIVPMPSRTLVLALALALALPLALALALALLGLQLLRAPRGDALPE